MEGIYLFNKANPQKNTHHLITCEPLKKQGDNPVQADHTISDATFVSSHLRYVLEHLIRELFSSSIKIRWVKAYFPFTSPRQPIFLTPAGSLKFSTTTNGSKFLVAE
jgi:hypothetical protein